MCALKKNYEYGTKSGNYWKIIGVHANSTYSSSTIRLALYKDEASRRKDEASYKKVLSLAIPGSTHNLDSAYQAIKVKVEFEDATDC